MPTLIALLRAEAYVVHSYAATAVERFLALKEPGGRPRLAAADVAAFAQPLLEALFAAFKHPERCGAGGRLEVGGLGLGGRFWVEITGAFRGGAGTQILASDVGSVDVGAIDHLTRPGL
jgi:hypothetical protein